MPVILKTANEASASQGVKLPPSRRALWRDKPECQAALPLGEHRRRSGNISASSRRWPQDSTAKLFCNVEFWIKRLPRVIEPLSEQRNCNSEFRAWTFHFRVDDCRTGRAFGGTPNAAGETTVCG
jgi:hypothetical protein